MRKLLSTALVVAVLATALINLSSCEKDAGKLPNIAFKTTAGYTHADVSVAPGDSVTIGITASKSEGEDVLKTLNISAAVGSGTAATIANGQISIPTAQEDAYDHDFRLPAAATSGVAIKYIFTVTNRDGLTNAVSLTVTAN